MLKLVALEGLPAGVEHRLDASSLTLGRAPTCDVVLDDDDVSREHCRIRRAGEGFVIEDLGSSNGTIVNMQAIEGAVPLQRGDLVVVGRAVFEVQDAEASSRPAAPRPGRQAVASAPAPPPGLDAAPRGAPVAGDAQEAALAGQRLQHDIARLTDLLSTISAPSPALLVAVQRAQRVGGAQEGRRLWDVCRAAETTGYDQRVDALNLEATALADVVSVALEVLVAIQAT